MPADNTAQMYADVILQHTVRLRSAEITVGKLLDTILHFHTFVEGDLTKIGLLLADLAPLPHTGEIISMDMTRALLQCCSGTYCSFPNLLYCTKRFMNKHDTEDRLASIISGLSCLPSPGLSSPAQLTPSCTPSRTLHDRP